ncbi:hypothetical protein [Halegenticoccus soli]|uniref:hypothetical protein n=1 Tax=Halegenticoccus soli TaxID=1985678 RepID=UPI00117AE694|nr:hypothetical protein [Halegenticoccus soli]
MSESSNQNQQSNPINAMFEMQRQSMKQGQQWLHQSMNAQKQFPKALQDTMESGRSVQQSGVDATRNIWKAYLDVFKASVPSDESEDAFDSLEQAVDDQFDAVNQINEQTWQTVRQNIDDNSDAYNQVIDQTVSIVDDSMNAYEDSLNDVERHVEESAQQMAQAAEETAQSASESASRSSRSSRSSSSSSSE